MSFDPILWDYGPNFEGPDDPNSIAGSGRHANLSLKDRWPGSRQGVRGFFDGQHIVDLVTVNLDPDLIAIAALSGTGIAVRTAANAWALRTLQAPAAGLTITNPAGVAGDMTFALANDLAALEGLASTGIPARTATDTWALRTITGTASQVTVTNGDGVSGNPTISLDATLAALAAFNTNGLLVQTAADTFAGRTLQGVANRTAVTNGNGVSGDPTVSLPDDIRISGTSVAFTLEGNTAVVVVRRAGGAPNITGQRSAGTVGSEAVPASGSALLLLEGAGWSSAGTYTPGARVQFIANEATWSSSSAGSYVSVQTAAVGATSVVERATFGLSARLTLAAGSATALTAPLKLTSGTVMTTAEAGALEYNGNWYATKSNGIRFGLGGAMFDSVANATTTGVTVETDLYSYTVPANGVPANNDALQMVTVGTITGHASRTRQIRVYFAGTLIGDPGANVYAADADWTIRASVIRASSTTARACVEVLVSGAATYVKYTALSSLDFTVTNILKVTGTLGASSAAGDLTARFGFVTFKPAANL